MRPPAIIRTNSQFKKAYPNLQKGDVVSCVLNLKPFEEFIFTDLVDRGVLLFPSAISQIASRSKCFQAHLLGDLMVPGTRVINGKADLIRAMDDYLQEGTGPVITKKDRADCGLGINKWRDCEDLFNNVSLSSNPPWPFVLQPFIPDATDIRVVWVGSHHREAYWRKNRAGFRNNLHFGGESGPFELSDREAEICQKAMDRAKFPFAHMDLLMTENGEVFLSEISLFGGTKGAKIDSVECSRLKKLVEEEFLDQFVGTSLPGTEQGSI